MKEVFSMWKHTKMVVLVALSAAIYAAAMIPFKGLVIIPGASELRPAAVFPVIFGLLFGPAGAWGAGIGSIIGDMFSFIGPGTPFGFIANFLMAYIPYKIWNSKGNIKSTDDDSLYLNSARKIINFCMAGILGAFACALTLGFSGELLAAVPFAAMASVVALNNSVAICVLGPPLMLILYKRVKKWDLLWMDIVDEEEIPKNSILTFTGTIFILCGILGGMGTSFWLALTTADQKFLADGFQAGTVGGGIITIVSGLGIVLILSGSLLQTYHQRSSFQSTDNITSQKQG